MDVFTLAAKLTLDSDSFESGIEKADKAGSSLSSKLSKIGSVAKKVATALVFKKGVDSLKSLATSAAAAGDKIDKNSQKIGMSRTAYQEWDYILSQCGASIDSMGVAMKTLNNKLESGTDAVGALGLSMEDLSGLNMEQRFEAIVKAFQSMPEGAEKSRLAVELFGKQGQELLPLLNSSADSIEELKQKFHDLGLEMSDSQIDAAVKYSDAMDTLQRVFDAIKYTIGAELLPVMTDWAEKAASYAGKLLKAYKEDGGLDGVFKVLNTDITTLTTNLKESGNPVLETLGTIIDGIWTGLQTAVGLFTDFPGTVQKLKESDSVGMQILGNAIQVVGDALQWIIDNQDAVIIAITAIVGAFAAGKMIEFISALNPLTIILTAIAGAALLIATNWESIKATVVQVWTDIQAAAQSAWESIQQWWSESIAEPVTEAWNTVQAALEDVWNSIVESAASTWETISSAASDAWSAIESTAISIWASIEAFIEDPIGAASEFLSSAWDTISSAASDVWSAIETTASDIWSSIESFIEDPIGAASDFLSGLWETISTAATDAWNAISDAASTVWANIQSFIEDPISAVQTTLQGIWEGISATATGIWDGLAGFISDPVGEIVGIINGIVSAAQSAIDKVKELMGLGDGSSGGHGLAKGLPTVPYDNFPARLHRGEMVLTASQARKYRDGGDSGNDINTEALSTTIAQAIREGMSGASVNSFLDGQNVTDEISRIVGEAMTARRFA